MRKCVKLENIKQNCNAKNNRIPIRVLLRFGFDTAESEPSKMCSLFTSRLTSGAIAGITCRRERQVRIDEWNLESTKKYVRSEFGMR